MAEFSFINVEQLVTGQEQHAVSANLAIEALAKGVGAIDVSVTAGNVTLTEAQSLSGVIRLTGAPGATRVVTVDPDISRAILFINATTGGQTIEVEQTGGTNFAVPEGMGVLLLSTTQAIRVGLPSWFTLPATQPAANADTTGATLGQLEVEVNELKQLLRNVSLLSP